MRIRTLDIINWMKISEAHFVFTDGINVLFGDNGEGKTSVFEAIRFLLTDSKRADSWKDYIKNDGSKEFDLRMSVQMSDKEDDIIKFHYKGLESKGSVDRDIIYGEERHTGADASEFLKRKFDQDMIENTAFSLQDGVSIVNMQPAKRREIFKKIFRSEFPDVITKLSEDREKISTEIIKTKTTIDLLQKATYQLYRIIEIDETELNRLKEELQESQASEVDKERLKLYAEKVKELNTKQSELVSSFKERNKYSSRLDGYKTDLTELLKKITENEKIVIFIDSQINAQKEAEQLHLKQFAQFVTSLDVKQNEKDTQDYIQTAANLRAEIALLDRHIAAHEAGRCESCGQKCDVNLIPVFVQQKETHKQNLMICEAGVERLKKELKTFQKKNEEFAQQTAQDERDMTALKTRKEKAESELSNHKKNLNTLNTDSIPHTQELLAVSEKNSAMISERMKELQEWLSLNKIEIKSDIRSVTAIQKEIDAIMESIVENRNRTRLNEETLKKKEENKKELETLIVKLNALQLKDKEFEAVKHIFEVDFPSYINLQACKILENYINHFFKGVKANFVVQLNQDAKGINFFYKAANEPKWNKSKMASGFEETMLTASFKCSVGYAYGNEFVILDEPDAKASEVNAAKFFKTVTKISDFKQIFTVTHREKAKEYLIENGANVFDVKNGVITRST